MYSPLRHPVAVAGVRVRRLLKSSRMTRINRTRTYADTTRDKNRTRQNRIDQRLRFLAPALWSVTVLNYLHDQRRFRVMCEHALSRGALTSDRYFATFLCGNNFHAAATFTDHRIT
jgi:hypothetical protein